MWIKILLLLFVFSFLFRTDTSFDQDLGRHLKIGGIIIHSHQVPKTNLFSYTNPNFPFINTHWLFEVITYLFAQSNALQFLLILKVIIILLSVYFTLKLIPKENSALLLPIGFIFLHILRERVELRPEIFSFLFTAATYYILDRFSKIGGKWIFLLPLIQLLWVNTHIYFFVGLILQAIFLIYMGYGYLRFQTGFAKLKLLGLTFTLSVLVSMINPNGLADLLYPLNVTKNYGYTIAENQTMFLLESINFRDPLFLFIKISAGIIIVSILFSLLKRRFDIKNILLSLTGLTLALLNVRSFPYLVFISLPATMMLLGEIKTKTLTKMVSIFFALLLLFESFFYLNGTYYKYTDSQNQVGLKYIEKGKGALDFVLAHELPGPIFNNFDIGSYILYRAYPKLQVFVDGRPEAYPAQFFQGLYIPAQSDYKNFKEVETLYSFKEVIFSIADQTPWGKNFLTNIIKDPEWRIVYIDDFMIMLTKPEIVEQKQLTVIDLAKLAPENYHFEIALSYLKLGAFLLNNNFQNGPLFIQKALQLNPQSPFANSVMASLTGSPIYQAKSKNLLFW